MVNALAHRDYELDDPTRTTIFSDRIEILSPGALPTGVKLEMLQAGKASPKWRNQSLAWFLSRLQLAQAEGQGIPTIFRSMRDEGCPPPSFEADEARVICTLPAHPRHALSREYRLIEEAISLGDFSRAKERVDALLTEDPLNGRVVQLLAEVAGALGEPDLVRDYIRANERGLDGLPPRILVQLAETLTLKRSANREDFEMSRRLLMQASRGLMGEREVRKVAYGLSLTGDDHAAVAFLDKQFGDHPEWKDNPYLLQVRGNSYIGLAKQCTNTARMSNIPPQSKRRAWDDCRRFLEIALRDLEAAKQRADTNLLITIEKNIDFALGLRRRAGDGPSRPPRR
jgi:hypothetical protein